MKIKIYQTEWYGIKFETFTHLNSNEIADAHFYEKFYEKFFDEFKNFQSIPKDIKRNKNNVAEIVFETYKNEEKILSIGCGNCLVEYFLLDKYQNEKLKIYGVDPGNSYRDWIDDKRFKYINDYFTKDFDSPEVFDCCYISIVDYAMSDNSYIEFLHSIYEFGIKKILLTDLPIYSDLEFYRKYIKAKILSLYNFLSIRHPGQFWGYLRPLSMHKKILHNIGFKNIHVGYLKHGNAWVTAEA